MVANRGSRRRWICHSRSALAVASNVEELPVAVAAARRQLGLPVDLESDRSNGLVLVHVGSPHPLPAQTRPHPFVEPVMPSIMRPFMDSSLPHNRLGDASECATSLPAPSTPALGGVRRRPGGALVPSEGKRARGSTLEAVRLASAENDMKEALDFFGEVVYAPSTNKVKSSMRRTWSMICGARELPVLPLTPNGLMQVCSVLRAAGFRSGVHYLFEMRQWHCREGFEWSAPLDIAVKDCKRALTRGIGPPNKAGELKFEWLSRLPESSSPSDSPEWPVDRRQAWVLACKFLLRECELSCLSISDREISFDHRNKTISICLPTSKTDCQGRGCKRTLSCCCKGTNGWNCPFCAALGLVQKQLRRTNTHPSDQLAPTIPLLSRAVDPMAFVSKEAVVAALRRDAEWLKESKFIPESFDVLSLSGHSFRRSGAKDYARSGVPMDLIKYLARHSSDATQGYVEEALEECPTAHDKLREHMSLQEQITKLCEQCSSLDQLQKQLTERVDQQAAKAGVSVQERDLRVSVSEYLRPDVIVNLATMKIHSTYGNCFLKIPLDWSTSCGWKWIQAGRLVRHCSSVDDFPVDCTFCDKCRDNLPAWCSAWEVL